MAISRNLATAVTRHARGNIHSMTLGAITSEQWKILRAVALA
jgi:hypothetical protein